MAALVTNTSWVTAGQGSGGSRSFKDMKGSEDAGGWGAWVWLKWSEPGDQELGAA